jgi:hypothetical protein
VVCDWPGEGTDWPVGEVSGQEKGVTGKWRGDCPGEGSDWQVEGSDWPREGSDWPVGGVSVKWRR